MDVISSDILIVNYFGNNPDKLSVTTKIISDQKQKLEKILRSKSIRVYIDFSRDSIINMLNNNPDLFERDLDNGIISMNNIQELKERIPFLNSKIPDQIREFLLEAMKDLK